MTYEPEKLTALPEEIYDSIQGILSVGEPSATMAALFQETETNAAKAFTSSALNDPAMVLIDPGTRKVQGPDEPPALELAHQAYETGLLYNFKGEGAKAIEALEKAYGLYLIHRNAIGAIYCLVELAYLKYSEDKKDGVSKSSRLFSEALKMIHVHMHEPGINEARARLIHYQGLVKYSQKAYGEAVRGYMYAKTFCRADGPEAARIYDSLALHYEKTNDYHRAIQCLQTALRIKKINGSNYEQAVTCQIMGRLYVIREEYAKGVECLSQALAVAQEVGDLQRAARIKNELIRLRIYESNFTEAERLIAEVEQECEGRPMRVPFGKSQFYKAYLHYLHSENTDARELLESVVLPIFRKGEYRKGIGMASRMLACIHHREHQEMRAIEEMSEVIAIFKEDGEIPELCKTYYELGKIYLSLNEQKLALTCMLEALRISESNGLSFLISHIEDEIFRLDERKWQEIVEKRANHDRVFDKEPNLMDALTSISDRPVSQPDAPAENTSTPNKRLISLLRVGQAMAAEREVEGLLSLIKSETEMALEADRCTVFIYDRDKNELWSQVATGIDTSEEIRFPAHLGLAGYVVKTGEVLNIKDAYEDPRFNKDIDKKTGYHTSTILCMPMRNRKGETIGVFQVLNKRAGVFDKVDEDMLTAIATNAGVAIENATLAKEVKVSFDSFVKTLSSTIDARDPITAGHSERVAEYAVLVGEELEMQNNDLEALKYASLLHDIGKIGIREDILKKDGRLTEKEYRHIQKHVYYTHEILKNVHFERHLQLVPEIAASHHEKVDGSGYHRGLKGDEIHLSGRILAIADVFDAITSRRHYRNRMAFDKVLTIMRRDTGSHFDNDCVDSFFTIPLVKLGRVLLMDQGTAITAAGQDLLNPLDRQITVGEYYRMMSKEAHTKGEADIHRLFSQIYHQMGG